MEALEAMREARQAIVELCVARNESYEEEVAKGHRVLCQVAKVRSCSFVAAFTFAITQPILHRRSALLLIAATYDEIMRQAPPARPVGTFN
jgi:hypothetical protein